MSFQSYSQAGQDAFAWGMNGGRIGTFLDIGCGHPAAYNNSYGLELVGWIGYCADLHLEPAWYAPATCRNARLIHGDATNPELFREIANKTFDYISIDVDESSLGALKAILDQGIKGNCITIEHDAYRLGGEHRTNQRAWLRSHGYVLARADVLWEGKPFEDWWILPV